jgi:hypothetical protein
VELVDPVGIAYCPHGGAGGFRALGLKTSLFNELVAAVHSTSQGNHRNELPHPTISPAAPLGDRYSLYIGLRKGGPTVMAWKLSRINALTYIDGH